MSGTTVAEHVTANGVRVVTVLHEGAYVTAAEYKGVAITGSSHAEAFWAGCSHMAFYLSWGSASPSNLDQAVTEAREEGA